MANSQHQVSKTLELHEKRDPVRNLWRNVLIVAIEDLLKKKEDTLNIIIKNILWKKCGYIMKTLI